MKRKTLIKILTGIALFFLLLAILKLLVLEPWLKKQILTKLDTEHSAYNIYIRKIHISFFLSTVTFEDVAINPKKSKQGVESEIESIELRGINLFRLIFKKDFDVNEITISNSRVDGSISASGVKQTVSTFNIKAKKIFINKINLLLGDISTSEKWLVKDGYITVYNQQITKADTLSIKKIGEVNFKVEEVMLISPDSFYTFKANGITYSASKNYLQVDSFMVQPNYSDYDFTARKEFQTDCIHGAFADISARDFPASDYLKTKALLSSDVKIGGMEINVFRDRRKKFRHQKEPMLQDALYNYQGKIDIDTVRVASGSITYTEQAENAKEPGSISFKKVRAEIFHATNDTAYRTDSATMKLRAEAMLMGKAKFVCHMKIKLFDKSDAFTVNGGLSKTEASDVNQILERNAFVRAESGTLDTMSFGLNANDSAATGELTMIYNHLSFKTESRYAVVPASLFRLVISSITSKRILDSNPGDDNGIRRGVIAYKRDPERFLFNYCFKSILTGIKSSITKKQGK